jgi:hypothetical protein
MQMGIAELLMQQTADVPRDNDRPRSGLFLFAVGFDSRNDN